MLDNENIIVADEHKIDQAAWTPLSEENTELSQYSREPSIFLAYMLARIDCIYNR